MQKKLSHLEKAVRDAVVYADIFSFARTIDELPRFLHSSSQKKWTNTDIKHCLASLKKTGILTIVDKTFVTLTGKEHLVERRKRADNFSRDKCIKAQKIAQFLGNFPCIRAVFLTGSVAAGNASAFDDIDILVITWKNWLWTARLFIVPLMKLKRLYRPKGSREKSAVNDLVCMNYWLDTSCLALQKDQQNLFTAHELVQMKALLDKDHLYEEMLEKNSWRKEYLGGFEAKKTNALHHKSTPIFTVFSPINFMAYLFQHIIMLATPKIQRGTTSLHSAQFYPTTTSVKVLREFKKRQSTKITA